MEMTPKQRYLTKPGNREKLREEAKRYNSRPEVKLAHANQRLLKRYGISLQEKEQMFNDQRGKCLICSQVFTSLSKAHLDHNHYTGQLRGLLCALCNTKIVYSLENFPELLNIASAYLEFYSNKWEKHRK